MLSSLRRKIEKFILQDKKLHKIDKMEGHLGIKEGRLLFKITKSLRAGSVIVEIGAFKGKSTCFIAEAIGSKLIQFFTIDTWYNDKMPQGRQDVFAEFLRNVEPYRNKIEPLRGYSYEAIKDWPQERKIDFLWIDGDHSYDGVKTDIRDWIPLVKTKGIVCFHDYRDAPGVKKAVDEIVAFGTIKLFKTEGCIFMGRRN